jgi:hypothetical protein
MEKTMNRKILSIAMFTLIALFIIGCGTSPTPTPLPTQPPQVITVVITATPPPATATPPQPSITPIPTVAITATVVAPTKAAVVTAVSSSARPAPTRTPTKPAASPTASALPIKFAAPVLTRPIWTEDQKDEVKFPGGAIVFDWQSVGGLGGDECYLIQANTEPVNPGPGIGVAADYWLVNCGDQTPKGYSVKFVLESPNRVGPQPTYSSLLLQTSQMWAHWSVSVVKNLGQCDPGYTYHCKYAPISPSNKAYFLFKGN